MGIAQGQAGNAEIAPPDLDEPVHHFRAGQGHGHARGLVDHFAHVHARGGHLAIRQKELNALDAAAGLDGHFPARGQSTVVQVLGHQQKTAARHAAGTAVAVEHAHLRVGNVALFDEGDAVAADAEVPVARAHAQRFGAGYLPIAVVDDDVVRAGALHLGKAQFAAPCAHVAEIDQLGVAFIVPAL